MIVTDDKIIDLVARLPKPPKNVDIAPILEAADDLETAAFVCFGADDTATGEILAYVNAVRRVVMPIQGEHDA